MALHPKYRINRELAETILATFGITKPTKKYERWLKKDDRGEGFDFCDFDEVLFESPYIFVIDWTCWLQEDVEMIGGILQKLDVFLGYEFNEEGAAGFVWTIPEQKLAIRYDTQNDDSFEDVVSAIQAVVGNKVEFRSWTGSEGSDGWMFAVLPPDEWQEMDRIAGEILSPHFKPRTLKESREQTRHSKQSPWSNFWKRLFPETKR